QYNPADGCLEIHEDLLINLTFHYTDESRPNRAAADAEKVTDNNPGFKQIYQACLLNYRPGRTYDNERRPAQKTAVADKPAAQINTTPFTVKVTVPQEGIYTITYEQLHELGADLAGTTNENLRVLNQGRESAVYCSSSGPFSPGDYLLFYGESYKSLYSRENIYWIIQGDSTGKRMQVTNGHPVSGYSVKPTFAHTTHAEKDEIYLKDMPPWDE
ncbi:MAG: hypothetical protein GY850_19365, partial [bacterium]|nr:hypothetical protein [bacterium]